MCTPKILIIEDEMLLLGLYSRVLRHDGYEIVSASSLEEANRLLAKIDFNVVICDVRLGRYRGTDALDHNRERLESNGTHIIIMSGEAHYRGICEKMGYDYFIDKPVDVVELLRMVNQLTPPTTS